MPNHVRIFRLTFLYHPLYKTPHAMTPDEARERIGDEGLFTLKKTPGPGLCCVKGCRKEARSSRKKLGDLWFCARHWQQRWRANNPKKSAYRALKDHAKARGIEFRLTPDYFFGLWECVIHFDLEAESRGDCVSIDRRKAHMGYVPGNVRVVTISENCRKGALEKFLPEVVQDMLRRKREKARREFEDDLDECPF